MVEAAFLGFGPEYGEETFGDVLQREFENFEWTHARMVVAWIEEVVGTAGEPPMDIMDAIESFMDEEKHLQISVGNAFQDTEREGIERLLNGGAQVYYCNTAGHVTFHPKLYLFYNDEHFTLYVGSVNFKDSAMLNNWEAMARINGLRDDGETFQRVMDYSDRLADTEQVDIFGVEE